MKNNKHQKEKSYNNVKELSESQKDDYALKLFERLTIAFESIAKTLETVSKQHN